MILGPAPLGGGVLFRLEQLALAGVAFGVGAAGGAIAEPEFQIRRHNHLSRFLDVPGLHEGLLLRLQQFGADAAATGRQLARQGHRHVRLALQEDGADLAHRARFRFRIGDLLERVSQIGYDRIPADALAVANFLFAAPQFHLGKCQVQCEQVLLGGRRQGLELAARVGELLARLGGLALDGKMLAGAAVDDNHPGRRQLALGPQSFESLRQGVGLAFLFALAVEGYDREHDQGDDDHCRRAALEPAADADRLLLDFDGVGFDERGLADLGLVRGGPPGAVELLGLVRQRRRRAALDLPPILGLVAQRQGHLDDAAAFRIRTGRLLAAHLGVELRLFPAPLTRHDDPGRRGGRFGFFLRGGRLLAQGRGREGLQIGRRAHRRRHHQRLLARRAQRLLAGHLLFDDQALLAVLTLEADRHVELRAREPWAASQAAGRGFASPAGPLDRTQCNCPADWGNRQSKTN